MDLKPEDKTANTTKSVDSNGRHGTEEEKVWKLQEIISLLRIGLQQYFGQGWLLASITKRHVISKKNLPICETLSQFGASVPKNGCPDTIKSHGKVKITFPLWERIYARAAPPGLRRFGRELWPAPSHVPRVQAHLKKQHQYLVDDTCTAQPESHPRNEITSLIWCRSSSQQRNLSSPRPNLDNNCCSYIFQGYWVKMRKTVNAVMKEETDPPCSQVPNFLWSVYQ